MQEEDSQSGIFSIVKTEKDIELLYNVTQQLASGNHSALDEVSDILGDLSVDGFHEMCQTATGMISNIAQAAVNGHHLSLNAIVNNLKILSAEAFEHVCNERPNTIGFILQAADCGHPRALVAIAEKVRGMPVRIKKDLVELIVESHGDNAGEMFGYVCTIHPSAFKDKSIGQVISYFHRIIKGMDDRKNLCDLVRIMGVMKEFIESISKDCNYGPVLRLAALIAFESKKDLLLILCTEPTGQGILEAIFKEDSNLLLQSLIRELLRDETEDNTSLAYFICRSNNEFLINTLKGCINNATENDRLFINIANHLFERKKDNTSLLYYICWLQDDFMVDFLRDVVNILLVAKKIDLTGFVAELCVLCTSEDVEHKNASPIFWLSVIQIGTSLVGELIAPRPACRSAITGSKALFAPVSLGETSVFTMLCGSEKGVEMLQQLPLQELNFASLASALFRVNGERFRSGSAIFPIVKHPNGCLLLLNLFREYPELMNKITGGFLFGELRFGDVGSTSTSVTPQPALYCNILDRPNGPEVLKQIVSHNPSLYGGIEQIMIYILDKRTDISVRKIPFRDFINSEVGQDILEIAIKNIAKSSKGRFALNVLRFILTYSLYSIFKNTRLIELLISHKENVGAKCINGKIFLMHAILSENKEIVNLLVTNGADVNAKDQQGVTPLILAAYINQVEIVDLLLKGGANIKLSLDHIFRYMDKKSIAAHKNAFQLLTHKLLQEGRVKHGLMINIMLYAVLSESTSIMGNLTDHLSELECNRLIFNCLNQIAGSQGKGGSRELFLVFLRRLGLEVNRDLLIMSLESAVNPNAFSLLVDSAGDEVGYGSTRDSWEFFLMHAASSGNKGIVEFLLKKKIVDAMATDNAGKTVLMYAASSGDIETVQFLLKKLKNIDINAKDSSGKTALIYAASTGYKATIRLLLSKGVDVGAIDTKGISNPTIIEIIYKHKQQIELQNNKKMEEERRQCERAQAEKEAAKNNRIKESRVKLNDMTGELGVALSMMIIGKKNNLSVITLKIKQQLDESAAVDSLSLPDDIVAIFHFLLAKQDEKHINAMQTIINGIFNRESFDFLSAIKSRVDSEVAGANHLPADVAKGLNQIVAKLSAEYPGHAKEPVWLEISKVIDRMPAYKLKSERPIFIKLLYRFGKKTVTNAAGASTANKAAKRPVTYSQAQSVAGLKIAGETAKRRIANKKKTESIQARQLEQFNATRSNQLAVAGSSITLMPRSPTKAEINAAVERDISALIDGAKMLDVESNIDPQPDQAKKTILYHQARNLVGEAVIKDFLREPSDDHFSVQYAAYLHVLAKLLPVFRSEYDKFRADKIRVETFLKHGAVYWINKERVNALQKLFTGEDDDYQCDHNLIARKLKNTFLNMLEALGDDANKASDNSDFDALKTELQTGLYSVVKGISDLSKLNNHLIQGRARTIIDLCNNKIGHANGQQSTKTDAMAAADAKTIDFNSLGDNLQDFIANIETLKSLLYSFPNTEKDDSDDECHGVAKTRFLMYHYLATYAEKNNMDQVADSCNNPAAVRAKQLEACQSDVFEQANLVAQANQEEALSSMLCATAESEVNSASQGRAISAQEAAQAVLLTLNDAAPIEKNKIFFSTLLTLASSYENVFADKGPGFSGLLLELMRQVSTGSAAHQPKPTKRSNEGYLSDTEKAPLLLESLDEPWLCKDKVYYIWNKLPVVHPKGSEDIERNDQISSLNHLLFLYNNKSVSEELIHDTVVTMSGDISRSNVS